MKIKTILFTEDSRGADTYSLAETGRLSSVAGTLCV
ncbi:hypothetical protein [uncultured Gammaproteobacteria bacterium]|nr:hypothetical protein [uncultured Gammaproteobacteria bacterium]